MEAAGQTWEGPAEPSVWLCFPPLVESNFGLFYPSTAVLAAYLEQHDIATMQEDLNEAFALYLLDTPMLTELASGRVDGAPLDSFTSASARWTTRFRERLFDRGERHRFGADNEYGYVLHALARPYSVDPGPEVLRGVDVGSHPAAAYAAFYRAAHVAERLPSSIRLAGITVAMGPQLAPALVLAQYLKESLTDLRVVLGGPAISLMEEADLTEMLLQHQAVDCAVRFDGEFPLLQLAQQSRQGCWDPGAVMGASYRSAGSVISNPPAPGPDINRLPHPRYPHAALERLVSPILSITQARGCYWGRCDYCDFVELYDGSPRFRGRRADNFVDEVAALVAEFGIRRFCFTTESIPPAFARRVSRLFIERRLDVAWRSFAMVDRRFDAELLALMVEAGCELLVIGLETTITRVLKLVHKSADREENFRFLRDARDVGMRLNINLIPDLPSTTYAESLLALADMEQLRDCFDGVSIFPFEATRSSNVGRDPAQFGLVPVASADPTGQAQYALNHLRNEDPAMTAEERREAHRLYRHFADIVNRPAPSGAVVDLQHDPSAWFRLAVDDADLLEIDDRLVCTNIGRRERIVFPERAARALSPYLTGVPFNVDSLRERVGAAGAARLMRKLGDARMLSLVGTSSH